MKLGKILNQLCKESGMSLSQLARDANVPVQTIHAWTTGRKSVNPLQVRAVAEVLKVSIFKLLFDESDPYAQVNRECLDEIFSGDLRVTVHKVIKKL